jgi:prepilin-type processing-associated H-X9-DG protein
MECKNHLHQLGLALQEYEGVFRKLPPGGIYNPAGAVGLGAMGFSVHARLLPYMEQSNTQNLIDFRYPWNDPINAPAQFIKVPAFQCPSDTTILVPDTAGAPNNYYANQGNQILYLNPTAAANIGTPNALLPAPNGVFVFDFSVRFADVRDGQSTTAAFSEKVTGDFSNGISTPKSDTFRPGTYPATPDQAMYDCEAVDVNDLTKQGYSNVGAPWALSYHSTSVYMHVAVPNGRSCMYPPGRIMTTANSYHPGGVNVAFCDGAVRFISNSVDLKIWRALGSRAGKEVINGEY